MEILRQIPAHHQSISSSPTIATSCAKSIYAVEKVREAIRDHEQDISSKTELPPPKHKAKVVVLGDSGVGKTSIIYRHRYGCQFAPVNATIGASFVPCDVPTANNEMIRLQVWDTAGQERFRCMVPMYMRNADAALIVYDVTNRESFENVTRWVKDLERSCGTDDTSIFLIGNKTDMADKRDVSRTEGLAIAAKINAKFFEISSDQTAVFYKIMTEIGDDVLAARERNNNINANGPVRKNEKIIINEDLEKSSSGGELKVLKKKKDGKCCSVL